MNTLKEIERVIELEIDALIKLRKSLTKSYAQAIELLFNCSGKVVVTGMGKSGIVAQKISTTMASTGTSAVFLHSGDGMHGDVGMVSVGDVVIAISKSGQSDELLSILRYIKKIRVPIIAITVSTDSELVQISDLVLVTPIDKEACPLDLVPTSSTTAALVVGDALAITLMKMRGLTPEDFAVFHPGGQLGRRILTTVSDIMRAGLDNPVVNNKDSVQDMLYQITSKRSGAVSVINDQGVLVGLVTDFDIRRVLEQEIDIFKLNVADIMNNNPTSVFSDEKAFHALNLMKDRGTPFSVLPVLDRPNNQVVGMIHLHDLVAAGL